MTLVDRRVLYISYNGMLDPLGQSQVIPYLKELSNAGVRFSLLSFERERAYTPEGIAQCRELQRELAEQKIDWHWLRYHKRPSLPATMFDVAQGIRHGARLIKKHRIELVHGRNPIMATIGLALKRRFGIKLIFDVRGLLADEYVDANHWQRDSLKFRLTKSMEHRCLSQADGLVTLTEAIWPIISSWPSLRDRPVIHEVVPCCVDLQRFKFDSHSRASVRAELGLQNNFVMTYSGSVGGWYLMDEMADFFVALRAQRPDAHFLWLVPSDSAKIHHIMRQRNIDQSHYTIRSVEPRKVSSYLSAADASIAFIKTCVSKLASSPTKTAEYLACGLPLIINAGIGDSDSLVTNEGLGVLVKDFTVSEYERAATDIQRMVTEADATRARARAAAERLFDVSRVGRERYVRLYEKVFDRKQTSWLCQRWEG